MHSLYQAPKQLLLPLLNCVGDTGWHHSKMRGFSHCRVSWCMVLDIQPVLVAQRESVHDKKG